MNIKPKKILYQNQKEIFLSVLENIKKLLHKVKCNAYLVGSITKEKFGTYEKPWKGEKGSDVDLIIKIKKENIPKKWIQLNEERDWWNLYSLGKIKIEQNDHHINAMVVKKNKENMIPVKIKELDWNAIKIK
jgi:predicted nucleotidyltransferase